MEEGFPVEGGDGFDGDAVEIHGNKFFVFVVKAVDEAVELFCVGVVFLFLLVGEVGEVGVVDEVFLVTLLVADDVERFAVEDGVNPSLFVVDAGAGVQVADGKPEVCCEVGEESPEVVGVGGIEV